jgi:hypothetical protein
MQADLLADLVLIKQQKQLSGPLVRRVGGDWQVEGRAAWLIWR